MGTDGRAKAAVSKKRRTAPTFVVQKHWASRLHYDFRLELDATLKSWAVPKGPSLDPKVKRMAIQVEDHPLAYADFEGTIAHGQYGAGRVIIWDRGTWEPVGDATRDYAAGHLKFILHGNKLHGAWALIRMRAKDAERGPQARQPAWLLIKEKNASGRERAVVDVTPASPDRVMGEPAPVALPPRLAPALATLLAKPPVAGGPWRYEIKFDGYRLMARVEASAIRLVTRGGIDWTARLDGLHRELAALHLPDGWYDGEIVVQNARGVPDFGALQRVFDRRPARNTGLGKVPQTVIRYYLFDLPFCAGRDLRQESLDARRALLQGVLAERPSDIVRFSEAFEAAGASLVVSACRLGLEGVIGKRADSHYRSGRTTDWIKLKCGLRQEFVIGGYTDPQGRRTGLGALLLGVRDESGALRLVGKVGSGFGATELAELAQRLARLSSARSPFSNADTIAGRPHWVRPRLVAEVSFSEWTSDGRLRQAVFHGLRDDLDPRRIVRERAALPTHAVRGDTATTSAPAAPPTPGVHITHPDRLIDAVSGTTKQGLVGHYERVGAVMMAHLSGRPLALLRAPDGVAGPQFFQKHEPRAGLPGVRTAPATADASHAPLFEVTGARSLAALAQWNTIEIHTVNCRVDAPERPDRMMFDLDPGQGVPWQQVLEGARLLHAFLQQLGLTAFVKTSGGKGLHIAVPLRRGPDWDTVKAFSRAIAQHLARTLPGLFVATSGARNRVGRIYIDTLRNGSGATTVAAWSARARPGLGVSVPVDWSELPRLTGGDHWTVATVADRLREGCTPWEAYARTACGLKGAMKLLASAPRPDARRKAKKEHTCHA